MIAVCDLNSCARIQVAVVLDGRQNAASKPACRRISYFRGLSQQCSRCSPRICQRDRLLRLNHGPTAIAVRAERAALRRLEGGCQTPLAAFAELSGSTVHLRALVGSIDGKTIIRGERQGEDGEAMGIALAEELLSRGAADLLHAKA